MVALVSMRLTYLFMQQTYCRLAFHRCIRVRAHGLLFFSHNSAVRSRIIGASVVVVHILVEPAGSTTTIVVILNTSLTFPTFRIVVGNILPEEAIVLVRPPQYLYAVVHMAT